MLVVNMQRTRTQRTRQVAKPPNENIILRPPGVDGTFAEISSYTSRFATAAFRSLVSNSESRTTIYNTVKILIIEVVLFQLGFHMCSVFPFVDSENDKSTRGESNQAPKLPFPPFYPASRGPLILSRKIEGPLLAEYVLSRFFHFPARVFSHFVVQQEIDARQSIFLSQQTRSKGWRSREGTRLPPMWPGFKSRRQRLLSIVP